MKKLMDNLDKAFENYTGDLTYFLVENKDSIDTLDGALKRGYPVREEMELLQDLYDNLDLFIILHSNHNENIGTYL